MCFMLIGGRDSFEAGMMLGGHNDDLNGYEAASLEIYPHMRHQPGASIQLPTGPVIPQPGETARCLLLKTFRGNLAGDTIAISEHGVCLMGGENLAVDRNDRAAQADPIVEKGVAGGVRFVALTQSRTARECVERIGRYYTEYGNRFPCAVGVFDAQESWYIEGGGGSTWLAVRVPDDCYLVQSNGYRINEVDWDDTENTLYSPGLREFVIDKGLWDPDTGPFHWARAFGRKFLEEPSTYFYNSRRIWRALNLLSPSAGFSPDLEEYPTFMKPDRPITRQQVMQLLRDYNSDNDFCAFQESGVANEVRPIGVPHCIHSAVTELRRDVPVDLGCVLWSCLSSPLTAPFLPHHYGITEIAPAFLEGSDKCEDSSAYWSFRKLTNLAMTNFSAYSPVVTEVWGKLEGKAASMQSVAEREAAACYNRDPEQAKEILTAFAGALDYEALRTAKQVEDKLHRDIAGGLYRCFAKGSLEW
ncbi:hypothetical protein D1641_02990 [Colidextribacter sp. OB.20]|uniref:dipeptidase n=1 Tax=Colidextribacter sp. OB.20 TaxID=2304568 RepID=UPI0013720D5F|nr:C69 family dipeptidase [Colidextribacter sp. OB.20]NBI08986.1 hypothetical protein [Colidextribacter sp. OB.20]